MFLNEWDEEMDITGVGAYKVLGKVLFYHTAHNRLVTIIGT